MGDNNIPFDPSRMPIDPKAFYTAKGDWGGWRKFCSNNLICDDCGNEVCECEKMAGVSLLIHQSLEEMNIPLAVNHVQELAVSHPDLLVDLIFEDLQKTVPSKESFSEIDKLAAKGHKLQGVCLSENVSQLRKMGLLPKY